MRFQINPKDSVLARARRFSRGLGRREIFMAVVIILVGFAGFGLGRLSYMEENKAPVRIEDAFSELRNGSSFESVPDLTTQGGEVLPASTAGGLLVASKKGTKYHFPWCPGAQQMSEENKIWFESAEEAESAGYTPAANCKGL